MLSFRLILKSFFLLTVPTPLLCLEHDVDDAEYANDHNLNRNSILNLIKWTYDDRYPVW